MDDFIQAIENATNRMKVFLEQLLSGILSFLDIGVGDSNS